MKDLINEIVKIKELSLQIKNKSLRDLYVVVCSNISHINQLMLDDNKSFEEITYEYILEKINSSTALNI
jgi:hypothetical protein